MTTRAALLIGALVVALLVADHLVFHLGAAVFLGRKFAALTEWVAFWR